MVCADKNREILPYASGVQYAFPLHCLTAD